MVWGVDLGVRSASLAGIDDEGRLELITIGRGTPKGKIADQLATIRAEELAQLSTDMTMYVSAQDYVFVEEPPAAGAMNLRTYGKLSMAAGAVVAGSLAPTVLVPVDTWKKKVVGKGGVSKALISRYLSQSHPIYAELCHSDQNLVDATCIALYGLTQTET